MVHVSNAMWMSTFSTLLIGTGLTACGPIAVARRLPIYIGSAWTPKPHAYTATILRNELDTGFFQLFLNACERLFA